MSTSRLPPPPDFNAIEAYAGGTQTQRSGLWERVGDLNFAWSNNESLLIYFIMLLLRTDEASAAIVFATLNTTRARLDLIERLARVRIRDRTMLKRIRSAIAEFNGITRTRNEINHCIFIVGEDGRITDTQSTRLQETRGRIAFGLRRPVDEARMAELDDASRRSKSLNRQLWSLLTDLEASLGGRPSGTVVRGER